VYGTIQLLPAEDKNLIEGIIINKFRGDAGLFVEGKKMLEELTGKPVVGIIPYFRDIFIEQEDSVVIRQGRAMESKINVAVVLLNHMSNFTDFDLLEHLPDINLFYTSNPDQITESDIVILPGSKNIISDLIQLQTSGLARTIVELHKKGKPVYGICGGFQMMGREILDPFHVEGSTESAHGLGILPVSTTLSKEKQTIQCRFTFLDGEETCEGYEIHMGETVPDKESPLTRKGDANEGYFLDPKTWGTYMHGILDNAPVVEYILRQVHPEYRVDADFKRFKEANYDKLADHVRKSVDMNYIYETILK